MDEGVYTHSKLMDDAALVAPTPSDLEAIVQLHQEFVEEGVLLGLDTCAWKMSAAAAILHNDSTVQLFGGQELERKAPLDVLGTVGGPDGQGQ